jgi:hypothetical protein
VDLSLLDPTEQVSPSIPDDKGRSILKNTAILRHFKKLSTNDEYSIK